MTLQEFTQSMTYAEKEAPSWLDLSDERLGQLVRGYMHYIESKDEEAERQNIVTASAAILLITDAQTKGNNAVTFELGITTAPENLKSEWSVSVKRIDL